MEFTEQEYQAFLQGLRQVSNAVSREKPDFYLISLNGGLPIFDALRIINRDITLEDAIYFPGTSRIKDCKKVLKNCFFNFFSERADESDEPRKILSIDEVVSGASIERLLNAYEGASREYARANYPKTDKNDFKELSKKERKRVMKQISRQRQLDIKADAEEIKKKLPLKIIGIRETDNRGYLKMKPSYKRLAQQGIIQEVQVPKIITMDNPEYQAVEFAHPESTGFNNMGYLPKVQKICFTKPYIDLMRRIARDIGADPERIDLAQGVRIIGDCEKYTAKN